MLRILVFRPYRYPADVAKLKKAVIETLSQRGVVDREVSIVIVGRRKMLNLAERYTGTREIHEVFAFPFTDPASSDSFVVPPVEALPLGDIVICYPEAREIAAKKNRMVDDVLVELAEHAALHLIGIHHNEE